MNWWLTVPLVVCLVHSGLSCIILLQNLTGQDNYDDIDDYALDDQEEVSLVDSHRLESIRGKRKTEDEKKSDHHRPVQCYVLRNNRLHPLRKRSRHSKGHRKVKHVIAPTIEASKAPESTTAIVDNEINAEETNESTEASVNSSDTNNSNITEPITPCMEHQIKLKQKNSHLFRGRKHCVYHEKHQDLLNDVSCDSHHPNQEKTEVSINDGQQKDQSIIYEVYDKDNIVAANPAIRTRINVKKDVNVKIKPKRPIQRVKHSTSKIKSFRTQNMLGNQTNYNANPVGVGNNTVIKLEVPVQSQDKPPEKESQEIDLFTPIKELEAFIAAMSKDDYENYFQAYWKNILVVTLLVALLLIVCFYYCLSARVRSSNDATLFLIKPDSCTNSNASSGEHTKYKKEDKIKPSASSGCMGRRKSYISDSDDYTTGRDKKSKAYEAYTKYKRDHLRNKRLKEEEQCLIKARHERKCESKRPAKPTCSIYSYKGSNYGRGRNNCREPSSSDQVIHNYCFYGNKEIKELFKQDPKHIYHFSSVDAQSGKMYKAESNVESYAETVTSSARSRFKVAKGYTKKSKYAKRKLNK